MEYFEIMAVNAPTPYIIPKEGSHNVFVPKRGNHAARCQSLLSLTLGVAALHQARNYIKLAVRNQLL